jgi:hypothetical protein
MDPSMQAAMQHMAEQLQQQQNAGLQQLQQQLQEQQAQAAANGAVGSPAQPRGNEPRLSAPPQYDGRTAGGVDVWLRELRKQFDWYGATMQTDAQRIRHGAAHLGGIALDWWESIELSRPVTWQAFGDALRTRFQPANSADAARAALDKLRHQPHQLVHEYTVEFRRLLTALPRMHEGDQVYRYVSGLQPRLAGLVRLQGPATIADAIAFAARVDGTMSAPEAGAPPVAGGSSSSAASGGSQGSGGAAAASAGVPMDINAVWAIVASMREEQVRGKMELYALRAAVGAGAGAGAKPRAPFVSNEQIQERRDRGACFACGEVGHRKFDCPRRK